MQKTVYYCDHCKKVIGDVKHVSLDVRAGFSGIAVPPNKVGYSVGDWQIKSKIGGFMHFHIKCIQPYFEKLEKEANNIIIKNQSCGHSNNMFVY